MITEKENESLALFNKKLPESIHNHLCCLTLDNKDGQTMVNLYIIIPLVFETIVGNTDNPLFTRKNQLTVRLMMCTCWDYYDLFRPLLTPGPSFTYLAYEAVHELPIFYSVINWLDPKKENCDLLLQAAKCNYWLYNRLSDLGYKDFNKNLKSLLPKG